MTFKDIVSGNISEEVLKASTLPTTQEKVYELERIEGSCQTEEPAVVRVAPVQYLTISPEEIAVLRASGEEETMEDETPLAPPLLKETPLKDFTERSDIIKLTSAVTESSKNYRQRMVMVSERRKLREEEDEDVKYVKEAREQRLQNLLNENTNAVDESKMVLDNLVCNFQNLSSRFNSRRMSRGIHCRDEAAPSGCE